MSNSLTYLPKKLLFVILFKDNKMLKFGINEFDKRLKGFKHDDAILIGIGSRSSSPVRIIRDINRESSIKKIYPIGEGAGYAGGITSAALDGLKTAILIAKGETK